MDFVEACRRFIAIDSSPSHGGRKIAEVAAVFCHQKGLEIDLQEEVQDGLDQANVIARPLGIGRPEDEFMLQTHLDTADSGPFQMWIKNGENPFDATIMDGRIYGLGAASKLDFLCKLEAISAFGEQKKWRVPPVLVGTYGEENGMTGALKLIRKQKISTKMALIGEPTDLRIVNAGKGFATVEIRLPFSPEEIRYRQQHDLREGTSTQSRIFRGKSVHSSVPHLGESAITKMLVALENLPKGIVIMEIDGGQSTNSVPAHAFLEIESASIKDPIAPKIRAIYQSVKALEREFLGYRDPEFTPATPTLNLGYIRTHPDHVHIGGSCRLPPIITQNTYEKWMDDLGQTCASVGGEFTVTAYKRPFRTSEESTLVRGSREDLRTLGMNESLATQASTNEASLFSRVGIDCVSFGAGVSEGNIHTPTENVLLEDLKKSVEFYRRAIERFCL